jgi:hypothetical protein
MSESRGKIIKSIIKTRHDVGTLGKGAVNPHGNYKYVSIDRYYEVVANAAAKNGLTWVVLEESLTLQPSAGRTGMIEARYVIDLYHESGEAMMEFSRLSILHPVQGAQTVGSAMSYVDKIFMRQTFAVATGEEDADATNPADLDIRTKPEPKPAPKAASVELPGEEGDWKKLEEIFSTFLPEAKDGEALKAFWVENTAALDHLKEGSPDAYKRVVEAFKIRKQQLKG